MKPRPTYPAPRRRAPRFLPVAVLALVPLVTALLFGWRPGFLGGGPPAEPRPITPRGDLVSAPRQ